MAGQNRAGGQQDKDRTAENAERAEDAESSLYEDDVEAHGFRSGKVTDNKDEVAKDKPD